MMLVSKGAGIFRGLCAGVFLLAASAGVCQLNWSGQKVLNHYAEIDNLPSADSRPILAADHRGNVMALWEQPGEVSSVLSSDGLFPLQVAVSQDNGETWGAPVHLPNTLLVTTKDITYAGGDNWVVVYTARDLSSRYSIDHAYAITTSDNGQTWSAPRLLSSANRPQHVQCASDGNGKIIAVWAARFAGVAVFSQSSDYGQTWTEAAAFAPAQGLSFFDGGVKLAYAEDGKWVTVLDNYPNDSQSRIALSRSTDNGETWEPLHYLTQGVADLGDLEASGDSAVLTLWSPENYSFTNNNVIYGTDTSAFGLYTFHINLAGPISHVPYHLDKPDQPWPNWNHSLWNKDMTASVAVNNQGKWVISSDHFESPGTVKVWSFNDTASTWTLAAHVDEPQIQNRYPAVVAAADGRFISAHQHTRFYGNIANRDVDVKRLTSIDGGQSWSQPEYLNSDATSEVSFINDSGVHMASDGNGTVVAAWAAEPEKNNAAVMVARSTDKGETFEPALSLAGLTPEEAGKDSAPQVLYDGSGQWLVFWRTNGSATAGYFSRSTDNGLNWTPRQAVTYGLVASNGARTILSSVQVDALQTVINHSADGGETWTPVTAFYLADAKDLLHTGGTTWIIRSESGSAYISDNDGANWQPLTLPAANTGLKWKKLVSNHAGTVIGVLTSGEGTFSHFISEHIVVSKDFGHTWEGPVQVFSSVPDTTNPIITYDVKTDLLWLGGEHWALFMRDIAIGRFLPLDIINFVWSSRINMVESRDGGTSWSAGVLVAEKHDSVHFFTGNVFNSGQNVIGTWDTTSGQTSAYGSDRDLFYKTAWLGEVAPPPPPPPPPPADGPNLAGGWELPALKYKTGKNGELKAMLKATLLVANPGNEDAEKTVIRYYLSDDAVVDATDLQLKPKNLGKLKPGKSKKAKVKHKTDTVLTGKFLIAVLDADGAITEFSETDNAVVVGPLF